MNDELILLMDTSFKGLSLVLGKFGETFECLATENYFTNQIAAARISGTVQSLLSTNNLELKDLNKILVSCGPGSFTGIKVGIAFATALASTREDLLLEGVSPLECLGNHEKNVAWFLPATKSQGYLCLGGDEGEKLFAVDLKGDSLSLESEGDRQKISLDILDKYRVKILLPWKNLEEYFKNKNRDFDVLSLIEATSASQAAVIKNLGQNMLKSFGTVEPRYIRKSAPEELLSKKES